ncbi:MAG: hypothetical protein HY700_20405, partial [Gemmatimonadetes bacterium]|nr:hypothetical protein [Gemmatimonadota bacterium]
MQLTRLETEHVAGRLAHPGDPSPSTARGVFRAMPATSGKSPAPKVYAWRGRPSSGCAPAVTLELQGPTRLSSDGTWLAVTQTEAHTVRLYRVATLASQPVAAVVGGPGTFNLPQSGVVS